MNLPPEDARHPERKVQKQRISFWDRWIGTLRPGYDAALTSFLEGGAQKATAASAGMEDLRSALGTTPHQAADSGPK
jgi:hypothetical protein